IKLVRQCPVPSPDETIIQNAGVMLVLEVSLGRRKRQVCVATAHILNGCDADLRKLGQLVSIMAAAEIQLRKDPAVPLILTGDFNFKLDSPLFEFLTTGRTRIDWSHSNAVARKFKLETWEVREVADSSSFAATVLDDVRSREVSHSVRTASVYDLRNIVDHILYGKAAGVGPRLEAVSRLELPESLAQLKNGLPGANLGSDHFALAAKFCFLDEAGEVEEMEEDQSFEEWMEEEEKWERLEEEERLKEEEAEAEEEEEEEEEEE
ncbi:hypothetical protein BGZ75_001432, partial [Mortierella antarctica]